MSDKPKLKVGFVGVRHYAAYRRERMQETGLYEILGAFNRTWEYAAQLEEAEGIPAKRTYEDLLDTPDLEAIVICSGAKFHAEQTIAALERGYHVFVEKPLCSTPAELQQLLDLQKQTGLVVGLGHEDHQNHPASLMIKDMIDSGEFGVVTAVEKTTAHPGGLTIQPGDWRGDPAKNPGGMLFQCGVHGFHELMFYFGPVVEVFSMMRYDVHTTGTADAAICQMRFASGLIGSMHAYHVTPYRHTMSILGTKMNLYRNDRFFDEGSSWLVQKAGETGALQPMEPVTPGGGGDRCGSVRSFYNAVREGGTPYPSLADGARAVAIVFAAEKSAKTNQPVVVPEIA